MADQAEVSRSVCPPRSRRAAWVWWLAAGYVATGFYAVRPTEQAVVRRCGRALDRVRSPGLHFGFPYGIDRVSRVKVFERKRAAVGTTLTERSLGRGGGPQQAECLTGDRNLVHVSAIVQYQVVEPRAYLFGTTDVPTLVRDVAASALADVIAGMDIDSILTVERIAIQNEVLRASQAALDRYGTGVHVASVSIESAAPPPEVADAFSDVTSARGDRQRTINEAEGYAKRLIPQARGEAQRMLYEAQAFRDEAIAKAGGDADRFLKMAAEVSNHRALTALRLLLETLEEVLPRLKKVVVDGHARNALDLGLVEGKE